ncbi:MAG: hypothetical protein UHP28_05950 [Treponema sp.]|nr:hypothetical protein [Treponema sp.]
MKKIFVLFSALTTLLCGLVFTSCDGLDDDFIAPKDKWVYKTGKADNSFEYTWGEEGSEKTVKFDLYANMATKEATVTFKNGTEKTVKPGLNVILVPKAETELDKAAVTELLSLQEYVGDVAVFNSFGKEADASKGDNEEGKTVNLSTLWTLIYNFNKFEDMGSKAMSTTTENLTLASDLKNLNFKRILYNMLGDKIFGE